MRHDRACCATEPCLGSAPAGFFGCAEQPGLCRRLQTRVCHAQAEGVEGYILDMRNNPGGLLRAGLDVARLWLDGEAAVFNVQGRDEEGRMAVTQARCLPYHILPYPTLPYRRPCSTCRAAARRAAWPSRRPAA